MGSGALGAGLAKAANEANEKEVGTEFANMSQADRDRVIALCKSIQSVNASLPAATASTPAPKAATAPPAAAAKAPAAPKKKKKADAVASASQVVGGSFSPPKGPSPE